MFGDLEDLDKMFGELDDSDIYVNSQEPSFDNAPETNIPDEPADMQSQMQQQQQQYQQQQQQVPPAPKKGGSPLILLLILVLICAGFYYYKTQMSGNVINEEPQQAVDASAEMGDYFYDKAQGQNTQPQPSQEATAPAGGDTSVVNVDLGSGQNSAPNAQKSDVAQSSPNAAGEQAKSALQSNLNPGEKKNVVVAVNNGGRVDPFVPFITKEPALLPISAPKFDVIPPPIDIPGEINPMYDDMVSTRISGIMYDKTRPSAIITVGGVDQLVHKGDVVKDYSIIDITKDRVVLKNGTNIYRASVGQEVNNGVNFNQVSNISRQFGGAYKSTPKGIIEINGSN